MLTLSHNRCNFNLKPCYNAIADIRYSINILNECDRIRKAKYLGNCWDMFDYDYYRDAQVLIEA